MYLYRPLTTHLFGLSEVAPRSTARSCHRETCPSNPEPLSARYVPAGNGTALSSISTLQGELRGGSNLRAWLSFTSVTFHPC